MRMPSCVHSGRTDGASRPGHSIAEPVACGHPDAGSYTSRFALAMRERGANLRTIVVRKELRRGILRRLVRAVPATWRCDPCALRPRLSGPVGPAGLGGWAGERVMDEGHPRL